ncbi:MAG: SH3 domain-containing protein [Cyanobacteria bacterium REEB459]|nr:SH3 domain-containing protein [Cyanobacteria bacterium REEB459]
MSRFLLALSKLILGLACAIMLLSVASIVTVRYFMGRLAVLPPKPVYTNESAEMKAADPVAPAPVAAPQPAAATPPPEANSYPAVVTQPIGLVLRQGPGIDRPQVGGLDYKEAVLVLEEPANQGWVKVRSVTSGKEGWIKSGNLRPASN